MQEERAGEQIRSDLAQVETLSDRLGLRVSHPPQAVDVGSLTRVSANGGLQFHPQFSSPPGIRAFWW